jgi:hypothetical protein
MLNAEDTNSLRGKLITTILEKWVLKSLFEQYMSDIRESLEKMFSSNLIFDVDVFWNMDSEVIDSSRVVGDVRFIDEEGKIKVVNFSILGTRLSTKEE